VPRISPFRGLVFDAAVAGPLDHVTAPPYDVISDGHRLDYLATSPFSVVHLDLAEGNEDPTHPGSRYARAAHLLEDWERAGALVRSPEPAYYAYEMAFSLDGADRVVRGLVCAMELEPWGGGVIPHERTMDGPVQDRLRLLRATATHLSAVYGTIVGPCEPLARMLSSAAEQPAPFTAVDEQGVTHRMWPVAPVEELTSSLANEPLMIADGHHRYTTALRYRDERHATDGSGPWDSVLTLVVDTAAEQLPVLPFHRLQRSGTPPSALGSDDRTREVADLATALACCSDDEVTIATITVEDGATRYRSLSLSGQPPAVRALHAELLRDLEADGLLRYVPDATTADAAVRRGEAAAAFLLPPTTPDRIREVIERGERLPQKATYFWPKPRTGMVMMPLAPPPAASTS